MTNKTFRYGVCPSAFTSKKNAVFRSFGCGSGLDPASIRSVDPDLDSESGSNSRRAKMIHKIKIEKVKKFYVLRAEGFSCSLSVLYGGLGISELQFLIKKISNFLLSCTFFQLLFSLKMLDPDPDSIRNTGFPSAKYRICFLPIYIFP
jgi:hypothetical protein